MAAQVGRGRHIVALGLGIAVEDGGHLLAGDLVPGGESCVAHPVDDAVGGDDHLVGDVDAEGAEDLLALLLGLQQLRGADAVDLRNHKIPEIHALRPVFLGEIYVAKGGGQHLAQVIMGLQIHPQVLPHLYIIGHMQPPKKPFFVLFP